MDKINFQNLPNQTTPVNASNLNLLQTNVENAIGEVVEVVNNTNGTAIKFDDGSMIEYGTTSVTTGTQASTRGGITVYFSDATTQIFPVAFKASSVKNVFGQINGGDTSALNWVYAVVTNSANTSVNFRIASTSSDYTRPVQWLAIGEWK